MKALFELGSIGWDSQAKRKHAKARPPTLMSSATPTPFFDRLAWDGQTQDLNTANGDGLLA
jgi:hypothetical protein